MLTLGLFFRFLNPYLYVLAGDHLTESAQAVATGRLSAHQNIPVFQNGRWSMALEVDKLKQFGSFPQE